MDIESTTQVNKGGFFSHVGKCLMAFARNIKSKVMNVAKITKKIGKDDPRRVIHSLKVGIALTLVSLFYYTRPLYDGFGESGIWAVLTVVVVFEFTVGATLSKGLNRGCATLVAATLGVGGQHIAAASGERGEPIVLGLLVFFLAAVATFIRFFPKIKQRYDYGMIIFILTFSLVTVSGYRVEKLLELAHERLSTILIGTAVCMIISIFICPVWAGEDLHNLVASNIEKLADFLEGFEGEYFQCSERKEKTEKSVVLEGYKSVLNTKATEESLSNFARWEPGHGRFRLRHPWKQYLEIGALARECACRLQTLNTYLHPEIQASLEFKSKIQVPCTKMISESSKALKAISSSMKKMTDPSAAKCYITNSKTATKNLKVAMETIPLEDVEVLEIIPVATVAATLEEIIKSVEKIYDSVSELSHLAHFKNVEPIDATSATEKPPLVGGPLLHRGIIKPVVDSDNSDHVEIIIQAAEIKSTDSPEIKQNAPPTFIACAPPIACH